MVTLICAKAWRSEYPWAVHERAALAAGLPPEVVQALAAAEIPVFGEERQKIAYEVATSILTYRDVSASLFEHARDAFGIESLIELVTLVGFYSTASIVAKVFDVELPERRT
jgi:4-carboxymuconolactone decarboxylase